VDVVIVVGDDDNTDKKQKAAATAEADDQPTPIETLFEGPDGDETKASERYDGCTVFFGGKKGKEYVWKVEGVPPHGWELPPPPADDFYIITDDPTQESQIWLAGSEVDELNLETLRMNLKCNTVQLIPCTKGALEDAGCVIWCNEEGAIDGTPINKLASKLLGCQVHGGKLRGTVIVAHMSFE
jgi:hypothetical protein